MDRHITDIKTVNDIYPIIGDGKYQVLSIAVVCLVMIPSSIHHFVMVFLAKSPEWTSFVMRNDSSTLDDICKLNDSHWKWQAPIDYSIVSEFGLYCGKETLIHLTTMLYFACGFIGASSIGYLADRFGRKSMLIAGLFCNISIGFTCGFAINFAMFMVLKVMAGLCAPALFPLIVVYATETVSEKKRTIGSLVVWIAFSVGNLLMTLTSYLTQSWRKVMFYTTMPYIFIVVMLLFIPETLPWLYQHGKLGKVRAEVTRITRINGRKNVGKLNFIAQKNTVECIEAKRASFLQLFSSVKMAIKTVTLALIWSGAAMTFLGLSLAADHLTGNLHRDFAILTAVEIVAAIVSIDLGVRFGRKKTCITCLFSSGLCLLVIAVFPHSTEEKGYLHARLAFGILGKFLTTIAFDLMATWTAEVYPTFLRSTACGFHLGSGYVGMMAAPWLALWLKKFSRSLPFYSLGGVTIFASLLMIKIGETNGKKLDEDMEEGATEANAKKQSFNGAFENIAYSIEVVNNKNKAKSQKP